MPSKKTVFGKEIPRAVMKMLKRMKRDGKQPVPITNFKRPVVEQALARNLVYTPADGQLAITSTGMVAAKI